MITDKTPIKYWLLAAFVLLVTAWFSAGYHHPDEHYQILEFATYKLGQVPASSLAWEWAAQIRPGLQPLLAIFHLRTCAFLGINDPFIQVFLLRILTGCLAFLLYYYWYKQLPAAIRGAFFILIFFFWSMPYTSVRFSSEGWSALMLGAGCLLAERNNQWRNWLWAGFLLGLAFQFRYQMGFAIIGIGLWAIWLKKGNKQAFIAAFGGGLLANGIGLLADYAIYGKWFFPAWNYLIINIFEGKAATFGVSPWWWYFPEYLMGSGYLPGLLLLIFAVKGFKQAQHHALIWGAICFIAGHCLIAHKELRFLFPALPALLVCAAYGWAGQPPLRRGWLALKYLSYSVNILLLLVVMFRPALEAMPYFKYIYRHSSPQTTLFARERNPYQLVEVPVTFYRPAGLTVRIVKKDYASDSIVVRSGDLFLSESIRDPELDSDAAWERVYCFFPHWMQYLKFRWLAGTQPDLEYLPR